MAQIAYVDWDGLVYYDGKVKKYVADSLEPTLKDGGRIAFNQLPEPSYDSLNYIYTITDDFQTDTNFQIPGRSLNAGTAVKVSEVAPATYRYTIFNEIISDADANQFAAINIELANLRTNLEDLDAAKAEKEHQHKLADISDYVAPDLSDYAIQADVDAALETKASIEDVVSTAIFSEYKDNVANQFSSIQSDLAAYKNTTADIFVSHEELADELTHIEHHFDEYTNTADLKSYYATKDYVADQIKNTQVDLSDYATKDELDRVQNVVGNNSILISSINSQLSEIDARIDAIPEAPTKTSQLINDSGFLTEHQSLIGYATETYVQAEIAKAQIGEGDVDLSAYYTKDETYSKTEVDALIPSLDNYATKTYVDDAIKDIPATDLSDYYTKDQVDGLIPDTSSFITLEDVENEGYATKVELEEVQNLAGQNSVKLFQLDSDLVDINKKLETIPTKVSQLENDAGYLTEHQSLEGLATEAYVDEAVKNVEIDLTGYATETYVQDAIAGIEIPDTSAFITAEALNGYAKSEDIPTDYLTEADLDGYSKFSGSYNDLTDKPTIPSLDGYATQKWVEDQNYLTEIPSDDTKVDKTVYAADKETFALKTAVEAALKEKANDILFTEDYRVSSPVGAFTADESVKDLTLAKIIEKLLGLRLSVRYSLKFFVDGELYDEHFYEEGQKINPPADPVKDGYSFDGWKIGDSWITDISTMPANDVEAHATFIEIPDSLAHKDSSTLVKTLIDSNTPTYVLDGSGNLVKSEYSDAFYREMTPAEAKADSNENYFYQIVDENDQLIESGYSVITIEDSEAWLTIALPAEVDIDNCTIQQYNPDPADPKWTPSNNVILALDSSYSIEGYNVYSVDGVDGGATYRIVINN